MQQRAPCYVRLPGIHVTQITQGTQESTQAAAWGGHEAAAKNAHCPGCSCVPEQVLPAPKCHVTPQTHRNISQIRDTHCGACVAFQAIPTQPIHLEVVKGKTGSRVKYHKSHLYSSYRASTSCCHPLTLTESAVRPNARKKEQGRGELKHMCMHLSLGR